MINSTYLITVSGLPAAGTSTIGKAVAKELGFDFISGGDLFREMATEHDCTLEELSRMAEENPQYDRDLDAKLEQVITEQVNGEREGRGLVVESRLAGFLADGQASVSVWLECPLAVRLDSCSERDESIEEVLKREQSEIERYREWYGYDLMETKIYDICLDTHSMTVEESVDKIVAELDPLVFD